MFAIYNTDGRRFRDTLENLRKVQESAAIRRTQLPSNVAEDETQPIQGETSGRTETTTVSDKARHAYREMLNLKQREPVYHAYQLMSHPVSTVREDMDVLTALRYFQQQGFQQMPVTSNQRRLIGMVSVQDLMQFVIIDGDQVQYLKGKRVADAMSEEVITADPVSDIHRVARAMHEYHLHSVPIVDEKDAMIGIVSRSDILRAVTQDPPLSMWS